MRIFILIMSLFFLYSCAAKKFAVRHADTYITHSIEKKLPLNKQQEKLLAKDVDHFLMQKKIVAQEMMPLIDKIDPEKPTLFDEIYDSFLGSYRSIAKDFSGILAKYIVDLNPSQQKVFFRRLSEDLDSKKEKDSQERLSDMTRKIEKLVGPLSKDQEKFLNDHSSYFQKKGMLQIKRKEQLHQRLNSILTQDSPLTDTKKDLVVEAFMSYQDESILSSKENISLVKEFIPTLSLKQKEIFRERVKDLKEIIGYYLEAQY
jgi:hypothetical protein